MSCVLSTASCLCYPGTCFPCPLKDPSLQRIPHSFAPDKRAMDCRRHGELSLFRGDPITVCSTPYGFLLFFRLPS